MCGSRLYVAYFEGDPSNGLEPDLEAKQYWLDQGVAEDHILARRPSASASCNQRASLSALLSWVESKERDFETLSLKGAQNGKGVRQTGDRV